MPERPRILQEQELARTRLFRVQGVELAFANGEVRQYEYLKGDHFRAVAVVPLFDNGDVMLVREYAAGRHDYELGLPKGRVEAGESYEAGANRELQEEIGYAARRLQVVKMLSLSPAYMSHRTAIVLARDLYPARLPGDEPEAIETLRWPLARLEDLLAREDFSEARSIAALYLVRDWILREQP